MSNERVVLDDDHFDDIIDEKIVQCFNLDNPRSFFLSAGAGSGKTRSLVKALQTITITIGNKLRLRGQRVGVITYTNNACDEIVRRLKNNPLIYVSTIHSFIWNLINGFNFDIKEWLENRLSEDIEDLQKKASRPGTKAEIDRLHKIESKNERLRELKKIKKFVYNPNSNNTERDALSHSEVLQLGAYFLEKKSLMQKILIKSFPILLIDECQDTNKGLMEAFISVQQLHRNEFSLGLFGDSMQRIYNDGKADLEDGLPNDWEKLIKRMNHRSKARIIELINKIRSDVDTQKQRERQNKNGGFVRLFAVSSSKDKQEAETNVMQQMDIITGDGEWNERKKVISLILEHHMAANRMGFRKMFAALYPAEELRLGLLDGSLSEIKIFSEIIWPILKSYKKGDMFTIANIVKKHSLLLDKSYIRKHKDEAKNILEKTKKKVEELCKAYDDNENITFGELLKIISKDEVFEIPKGYTPILKRIFSDSKMNFDEMVSNEVDNSTAPSNDTIECLDNFLNTQFSQIQAYTAYVNEQSPFFTHQGVKGLEFPRVMAIIDDSSARGFGFSYEKLFGIKNKTETDIKNELEGKETGIDRTRRLFYVICSRAQESLAIVAYTEDPIKLKDILLGKGWFSDEEIIVLN